MLDSTKVFSSLFTDGGKRGFRQFLESLQGNIPDPVDGNEVVISMHYTGDLTPLMILSSQSDTSLSTKALSASADSCGLKWRYVDCSKYQNSPLKNTGLRLLLFSPSEALMTSVNSHLDGGMSILDKDGFAPLVASVGGKNIIMASNEYAGKLFSSYSAREVRKLSSFFRNLSQWTAFSIYDSSDESLRMKGTVSPPGGSSRFAYVMAPDKPSDVKVTQVAPSNTVFISDMPLVSCEDYIERYKAWLDAGSRLDKYRVLQTALKDSVGINAEQWASRLEVKEVARLSLREGGELRPVVAIRPGKEDASTIFRGTGIKSIRSYKGEILHWNYPGFASSVFGAQFSLPDESSFLYRDGWIIIGDAATLKAVVDEDSPTLSSALSEAGLSSRIPRSATFLMYFNPTEFPPALDATFSASLSEAFRHTAEGISFQPIVLSMEGLWADLSVDRVNVVLKSAPAAEKDTVIVVPEGPWHVRNSATGKMNLLAQNPNRTISFKEEDGKNIWTIPFKNQICGYVDTVDYYGNGKLQYFFCAGENFYLLDRQGRFVGGFPKSLGKQVTLGPGIHDFQEFTGLTAMVLFADNTIGMYDLDGNIRSGWQGITSEEKIKSLPILVEVKGVKYWAVRTSVQTLIYPFMGGEPVVKPSESRMIRPDSELEVDDNTLYATCYDGKRRAVKLPK